MFIQTYCTNAKTLLLLVHSFFLGRRGTFTCQDGLWMSY